MLITCVASAWRETEAQVPDWVVYPEEEWVRIDRGVARRGRMPARLDFHVHDAHPRTAGNSKKGP
ncbi:MAG: hypothetical protein ABIP48_01425 [Planctomycetota bacterium]